MGEAESLLLSQGECKHRLGTVICCGFSFSGDCRERALARFGEWVAATGEGWIGFSAVRGIPLFGALAFG